jgi:hypothetical protein
MTRRLWLETIASEVETAKRFASAEIEGRIVPSVDGIALSVGSGRDWPIIAKPPVPQLQLATGRIAPHRR